MKRRNGLTLAAVVLLFSACSLASTIDPGGIIRSGSDYGNYAIIEPDLTLSFDNQTVTSFNIFDAGFCFFSEEDGGQQCNFENQSGKTIFTVNQFFASKVRDFNNAGGLSCQNQINPNAGCSTGVGNTLSFFEVGIPSLSDSSTLAAAFVNTDSDFNMLYLQFTTHDLGNVKSTSFSVPEPASLGLMFSGLFALGLSWKRRARTKSR
jgi:PEP-CTERM motif